MAERCHDKSRTYVGNREGRKQWLKNDKENQWLKDAMSWLKDADVTMIYKNHVCSDTYIVGHH